MTYNHLFLHVASLLHLVCSPRLLLINNCKETVIGMRVNYIFLYCSVKISSCNEHFATSVGHCTEKDQRQLFSKGNLLHKLPSEARKRKKSLIFEKWSLENVFIESLICYITSPSLISYQITKTQNKSSVD